MVVCENDKACAAFQPRFPGDDVDRGSDDEERESNMVCYKGGLAVQQNYQMCDVTSESASCIRMLAALTD